MPVAAPQHRARIGRSNVFRLVLKNPVGAVQNSGIIFCKFTIQITIHYQPNCHTPIVAIPRHKESDMSADVKDFGKVVFGAGYGGVSAPTNAPIRK